MSRIEIEEIGGWETERVLEILSLRPEWRMKYRKVMSHRARVRGRIYESLKIVFPLNYATRELRGRRYRMFYGEANYIAKPRYGGEKKAINGDVLILFFPRELD